MLCPSLAVHVLGLAFVLIGVMVSHLGPRCPLLAPPTGRCVGDWSNWSPIIATLHDLSQESFRTHSHVGGTVCAPCLAMLNLLD